MTGLSCVTVRYRANLGIAMHELLDTATPARNLNILVTATPVRKLVVRLGFSETRPAFLSPWAIYLYLYWYMINSISGCSICVL